LIQIASLFDSRVQFSKEAELIENCSNRRKETENFDESRTLNRNTLIKQLEIIKIPLKLVLSIEKKYRLTTKRQKEIFTVN